MANLGDLFDVLNKIGSVATSVAGAGKSVKSGDYQVYAGGQPVLYGTPPLVAPQTASTTAVPTTALLAGAGLLVAALVLMRKKGR